MAGCTSEGPWSADAIRPSADDMLVSVDAGYDPFKPQPGWPCYTLGSIPPSVADRQADPSADDLLPQILALTPRGPAWGTDESGDGSGASPVMRRVWKAVAAWVADLNRRDFELATQAFPSAITFSLPDWERELGLPDLCFKGQAGPPARIAAVRARFGAIGGQSPAYFVCLAKSIGYDITIEEPTQFMVDLSEVVEDSIVAGVLQPLAPEGDQVADELVWKFWIVHVAHLGETWFLIDEGECSRDSLVDGVLQPEGTGDRLEGFFTADDLECLMRRYCPPHTQLVFDYSGLG